MNTSCHKIAVAEGQRGRGDVEANSLKCWSDICRCIFERLQT